MALVRPDHPRSQKARRRHLTPQPTPLSASTQGPSESRRTQRRGPPLPTDTTPHRTLPEPDPQGAPRAPCKIEANGARRTDPQLAAYYQRLMRERGYCRTQATVAVARKLIERTWTVLSRGEPYQLRDVNGTPVTAAAGRALARTVYAVPEDV